MRGGALGYLLLGLSLLVLAVLGVFVFQLDTLEERFIQQSKQLRSLGESTERLAGRVERLGSLIRAEGLSASATGGARVLAQDEQYSLAKVRHPEVPNLLEPHDFQLFGPEAKSGGPLLRGWPSGDLKGFNPIIESAADLSNLAHYTAASLVGEMIWRSAAIAKERGIANSGYRTVFNCNRGAGQTVFHIHLHRITHISHEFVHFLTV